MRRLVAISKKTSRLIMALVALTIALTSIHLAAAARNASLRREQERLEAASVSPQPSAFIHSASLAAIAHPLALNKASTEEHSATPASSQSSTTPSAHTRQIVISIADRKLALIEDGHVLKTYPIAVGTRGTPSPNGDFVIVNRAKDPTYRHGDTEIGPGKDNPLGSRWMGLNLKGYGIHGTNVQSSVGKAASHGCFRMRKQDVEELYTLVQVGDTVTVRRERDEMAARVFAMPAAAAAAVTAQPQNNAEVQVATAAVTTVETTQQ
jgi:lipoprotein-anchoring transpeptidase ErfK/SrfK